MSEPKPFAYLDAPNSALYARCMRVFVMEKRRFVVHLRPEDVAEALAADDGPAVTGEQVAAALEALHGWGNLRADPDTSRVTTVEDFYRARYLYQLSRHGEAAERALETYHEALGRRGELQAVALEDIRIRLRALREHADRAEPDPAVVHSLLLELSGRLDSLAANASAFMGSLQRTIDLHDVDEEAFLAYKDRLITYLERFVSELVVKAYEIATMLDSFDPRRIDLLLGLAAQREAADVAPGDEQADPGAYKHAEWRNRWSGLRSWFVGDRTHPSQATLLRQRARKAIPDLLAAVSVLQERRAGRSDRTADFRELACWFAEAGGDQDAHRLWRAAFGLAPARHLPAPDGEPAEVPASTSWHDAPVVEISPRLRQTGHYQRRGAPSRVVDRTTPREHLARQVAAERAQTELARRRLATGHPTRLGELGTLDRAEFGLFVRLLREALAAGPPGPDGVIRTRTADGSLEIAMTPVDGAPPAEIVTVDGVLRGPEHELTIVDRTAPTPAAREAQGAGR